MRIARRDGRWRRRSGYLRATSALESGGAPRVSHLTLSGRLPIVRAQLGVRSLAARRRSRNAPCAALRAASTWNSQVLVLSLSSVFSPLSSLSSNYSSPLDNYTVCVCLGELNAKQASRRTHNRTSHPLITSYLETSPLHCRGCRRPAFCNHLSASSRSSSRSSRWKDSHLNQRCEYSETSTSLLRPHWSRMAATCDYRWNNRMAHNAANWWAECLRHATQPQCPPVVAETGHRCSERLIRHWSVQRARQRIGMRFHSHLQAADGLRAPRRRLKCAPAIGSNRNRSEIVCSSAIQCNVFRLFFSLRLGLVYSL